MTTLPADIVFNHPARANSAGVLHGDLPQPHMRAAAVADINQNEGRRLNHRGGE